MFTLSKSVKKVVHDIKFKLFVYLILNIVSYNIVSGFCGMIVAVSVSANRTSVIGSGFVEQIFRTR